MTAENSTQLKGTLQQPISIAIENKADLVRLFELLMKIDRRVNGTKSNETQNNGNPNNTDKTC